jgi:hypothetical protein
MLTRNSASSSNRGSALVITMFALVLLTAMGLALLSLGHTEIEMSRAGVRSKQAFYLAEAGLEHARLALHASGGSQPFDDALTSAAGSNGVFDFDPYLLTRVYDDQGNPTMLSGFGDDEPVIDLIKLRISEGVDGWYAAFLMNDPTETDELTDTNDRVLLTGVGLGPDRSFEIVQTVIEYQEVTPPIPPATVTIAGPPPEFEGGASAAMVYTGSDCDGAGDPAIRVPTIGIFSPEAREAVIDGMGREDSYSSGDRSGADSVSDLTDPEDPLVTSEPAPIWTDCMEMRQLMERIRDAADIICTDGECPLPEDGSAPVIFVDGDFRGPDGAGILAITGVLRVGISWDWTGLVLVIGKGEVHRLGGGRGEISGAMVIADIAGSDRILFTPDDCSYEPDGFGTAIYETNGGGNSLVSYCLSAFENLRLSLPYKSHDFRQF